METHQESTRVQKDDQKKGKQDGPNPSVVPFVAKEGGYWGNSTLFKVKRLSSKVYACRILPGSPPTLF